MHARSQQELRSVPKWTVLHRRFARPIQAREPQSVVSRTLLLVFRKRGKSTTQMNKVIPQGFPLTKFAGFSGHEFVCCRHTRHPQVSRDVRNDSIANLRGGKLKMRI